MCNRIKSSIGFTLIELMVTFVILGILATIAAPLTQVIIKRGKEQELHSSLRQIREALDAYKTASDDGRIYKSLDESGFPANLKILEDGVEDIKDPKRRTIYFIRRIPRDPMVDNVNLKPEETWSTRSYRSAADNPKEGDDVFDVYSSSKAIGLNGIPYSDW